VLATLRGDVAQAAWLFFRLFEICGNGFFDGYRNVGPFVGEEPLLYAERAALRAVNRKEQWPPIDLVRKSGRESGRRARTQRAVLVAHPSPPSVVVSEGGIGSLRGSWNLGRDHATEVRVLAERRLGELRAGAPRSGGGNARAALGNEGLRV
jgi:hypothetical protein